jgi:hypothetical protein
MTPFIVVEASPTYVNTGLYVANTNLRYSDDTPFPLSRAAAQFGDEESIYTNML